MLGDISVNTGIHIAVSLTPGLIVMFSVTVTIIIVIIVIILIIRNTGTTVPGSATATNGIISFNYDSTTALTMFVAVAITINTERVNLTITA